MEINQIFKCQKNRYPFLFIDRILDIAPGKSAMAIKAFSYNEMFFPGHFEDDPNVPGFIQLECLVQTFLMTFQSLSEYSGLQASDAEFSNVRFLRKIVPGEVLRIEATLNSVKRGIAIGSARSFVNDEAACRAEFIVVVPDILNKFIPSVK